MSSNRLYYFRKVWPDCRWLWLSLALLGILLPLTGWPAVGQLVCACAVGNSSDEREEEFPGEDEEGDSADSELEAHLLFRRSPRESRPCEMAGQASTFLPVESDRASRSRAVGRERDTAACSAAPLPLRC